MPEYKRFIAYFYEYINGKKQKNAGFAKVELRSGMWRILFRLMTDIAPEPPVQVYGFVRRSGYLLGIPMGTMRSGREMAEEWAYRAGVPLAKNYRLEDLSGICIQGGEGRCFLTVWDDEPIETQRLVTDEPEELPRQMANVSEEPDQTGNMPEEVSRQTEQISEEAEEIPHQSENMPEEIPNQMMNAPEGQHQMGELPEEIPSQSGNMPEEIPRQVVNTPEGQRQIGELSEGIPHQSGNMSEGIPRQMVNAPKGQRQIGELSEGIPHQSGNMPEGTPRQVVNTPEGQRQIGELSEGIPHQSGNMPEGIPRQMVNAPKGQRQIGELPEGIPHQSGNMPEEIPNQMMNAPEEQHQMERTSEEFSAQRDARVLEEEGKQQKKSGSNVITKWEEKSGEESECVPETAKITEMQSATEKGKGQQAVSRMQEKCCDDRLIQELLQKRQAIQERTDTEFVRCVMIMPCDVVRLQQEGYQAGRSSFLQHAFYQYRHLLLALTREGDYVLGVPGIQNPQEQYMAEMFGYRDFRMPRVCGCGRVFGYWCRKLCRQ